MKKVILPALIGFGLMVGATSTLSAGCGCPKISFGCKHKAVKHVKKAKKAKVHAIFTQPEFSDKASQNIARNLKIPVVKASPLAENWAENLKRLARAIAHKETK